MFIVQILFGDNYNTSWVKGFEKSRLILLKSLCVKMRPIFYYFIKNKMVLLFPECLDSMK